MRCLREVRIAQAETDEHERCLVHMVRKVGAREIGARDHDRIQPIDRAVKLDKVPRGMHRYVRHKFSRRRTDSETQPVLRIEDAVCRFDQLIEVGGVRAFHGESDQCPM